MSNNAVTNTFDSNLGSMNHAWNIQGPSNGAVTLGGGASMMEWATGRDAGHGYGTYTVTAKVDGSQPGPGIILWPGDNQWPGQEVDMLEITPDGSGRQYGTVHWNENGHDAYQTVIYEGVNSGQFHDYTLVWEPGKMTFKVDGKTFGSFDQHIPTDHDHGGMNNTIGALNNNYNTSLTIAHAEFTPLGNQAAATQQYVAPQAQAAPAPAADSGHIDWNALAAIATANFEATGHWFI